jgi:hypothetical protein
VSIQALQRPRPLRAACAAVWQARRASQPDRLLPRPLYRRSCRRDCDDPGSRAARVAVCQPVWTATRRASCAAESPSGRGTRPPAFTSHWSQALGSTSQGMLCCRLAPALLQACASFGPLCQLRATEPASGHCASVGPLCRESPHLPISPCLNPVPCILNPVPSPHLPLPESSLISPPVA